MSEQSVVLVTGSTDGIGRATAAELARRGARVIIHGRNTEKVARVLAELGAGHEGVVADFASLSDVRRMSADLVGRLKRLDALVHNAATYETERRITADGLERTLQVNHFAPFLLTSLLLPLLERSAPSRIVTVTAGAHTRGNSDLGDYTYSGGYDAYQAYCDSKLANVLFAYALARRLGPSRTISACVDPGAIATKMLAAVHPELEGRPAADAASEIADVVLDYADINGEFLKAGQKRHSVRKSYDEPTQDALWDAGERLTAAR